MSKKTTTPAKRKNASSTGNTTKNNRQVSAIAILTCFIISILLGIFMYIDSTGMVNGIIKNILKGLFGNIAYAIPVSFLGMSIYLTIHRNTKRFRTKSLLLFFILCNISSITHLIYAHEGDSVLDAYQLGIEGNGGGFWGAISAYGLQVLFNDIAAFVVLLFILFILLSVFTRVSIFSAIFSFFKGVFTDIKDDAENIQTVDNTETAVNIKRKLKKTSKSRSNEDDAILDISLYLPSDVNDSVKTAASPIIPTVTDIEQSIVSDTEPKDVEIEEIIFLDNVQESNSEKEDFSDVFNFDDLDVFTSPSDKVSFSNTDDFDLSEFTFESEEFADAVSCESANKELDRAAPITAEEQMVLDDEIENALESPKEYIFPSVDFLAAPSASDVDSRQEMHATATKLIEILKNFGVDAKLIQVSKGPSVTRYEIQPTVGTKLNKISALADDIALNLAAQNVLIAPVPDKAGVIGIEVPNREVASVYVRELIESNAFINAKSKLSVVLGKDIGGKPIVGDIAQMPHVLIAGQTGSGKSVCINTIITSILYKSTPDEVKMIMIDPKVVELGVYNGIPHLLIPVVTDPKRAAASLNWAVQEMMKRYELFAETGVRNLEGYNKLREDNGEKKMPQLLIIIDELADLMMVAAKEVEDYICRLAQLARAAGIHLIIATQRPSVDVITGLIKANVPSRIAFAVASQVDSRTILNYAGAEKLLGRGDMLYAPAGARSPLRVQGAFVTDGEIEKIVTFLKETSEQESYSEDLAEHIERHATGENGVTPDEEDDGDTLLPQAIELAVSMGQISTSMVQRKFRIGYARAGRIIDQMEARGIISGPNGSKPREVIVGHMDLSE